ncbi:hypothetical protein J3R30DRAFT_1732382 [Lentinula aciculospora]|uniref:Uncharacterized protein n=1 Tax=Lentinula aciculospora TaxID=153920 RepID=A0A9W8ZV89_9AGAR|nr:hypothetical protein J3R30DRAFT_1732382 [Lentinula aciculospora]
MPAHLKRILWQLLGRWQGITAHSRLEILFWVPIITRVYKIEVEANEGTSRTGTGRYRYGIFEILRLQNGWWREGWQCRQWPRHEYQTGERRIRRWRRATKASSDHKGVKIVEQSQIQHLSLLNALIAAWLLRPVSTLSSYTVCDSLLGICGIACGVLSKCCW